MFFKCIYVNYLKLKYTHSLELLPSLIHGLFIFLFMLTVLWLNRTEILRVGRYSIKIPLVQNPPNKILYFRYLIIYLKNIWFFLFIFYCHYYPNPYPRLVSGSRIWLCGFWTRVDFERVPGWHCVRVGTESLQKFVTSPLNLAQSNFVSCTCKK